MHFVATHFEPNLIVETFTYLIINSYIAINCCILNISFFPNYEYTWVLLQSHCHRLISGYSSLDVWYNLYFNWHLNQSAAICNSSDTNIRQASKYAYTYVWSSENFIRMSEYNRVCSLNAYECKKWSPTVEPNELNRDLILNIFKKT